jgi:hypothetical protein
VNLCDCLGLFGALILQIPTLTIELIHLRLQHFPFLPPVCLGSTQFSLECAIEVLQDQLDFVCSGGRQDCVLQALPSSLKFALHITQLCLQLRAAILSL